MIIQMLGMDAEMRERLGRAVAKKIDAWYLDSRHLPMGHTQPQQARWLRVVSVIFDFNYHGDIITSGYFATAESRDYYRLQQNRIMPDLSIYVDTIPHEDFDKIPGYIERIVHNVDNHEENEMQELSYWEEPNPTEYDIHITVESMSKPNAFDYWVGKIVDEVQAWHERNKR